MATEGRSFRGRRKVRLGDVERSGRLRFDALTRYTQDVSDDDTTDAGLPDTPGWVVRSTVVDQLQPAELAEELEFVTFCSGLGRRWAERRLSITGDRGARYEVATLWVCVDPVSGQPCGLTEQFHDLYGRAADGRRVSARLRNPKLADHIGPDLCWDDWQLRNADYDIFGHVNNAAYWALVEQWLPAEQLTGPLRARMEYGAGLRPAEQVRTARTVGPAGLNLWWLDPEEDLLEPGPVAADSVAAGQQSDPSSVTPSRSPGDLSTPLASVSTEPILDDLYPVSS